MASSNAQMTVVSTKGQVILPKSLRDKRDWKPGTRLIVEETADGVTLKRAPAFAPTRMEDVFGSLSYKGAPKTIGEMNASIIAEARSRHARGRY